MQSGVNSCHFSVFKWLSIDKFFIAFAQQLTGCQWQFGIDWFLTQNTHTHTHCFMERQKVADRKSEMGKPHFRFLTFAGHFLWCVHTIFSLTKYRWCFNRILNFRVRSMDVMAFLRNGIIVGVTFAVVDWLQSMSSIVPLVHILAPLDADARSPPLVDAIRECVIDVSPLNGDNSISLNHLFNIWHILLKYSARETQNERNYFICCDFVNGETAAADRMHNTKAVWWTTFDCCNFIFLLFHEDNEDESC